MTTTKLPSSNEPPPRSDHKVALWAGVSSFFGSLVALGVIDLANPDDVVRLAAALPVAFITAGAVYAKERLDDAKREREWREKRQV